MKAVSRRQVLRGAGVALALPWLETFAPGRARAQAAATAARKRYISMFYPHGAVPYYWPAAAGVGDAWQLTSVLEPLAALKSKMTMLGGVSNYATWGGHIEPSHGNVCAGTWTCTKANGVGNVNAGISVDQAIAKTIGAATPLSSLQVGLSTLDSSTEGLPGQHSRSISWADPQTPLYKIISPQAVFDRLVGGGAQPTASANTGGAPDPAAERRRLLRKSSLDYLMESTAGLQARVSGGDRVRLDKFLTSVRALEKRAAEPVMQVGCVSMPRPNEVYAVGQSAATVPEQYAGDKPPAGYDRGHHADLMIDLVAMAIQCDMTRVVSFMLDDERSDFVYDFVPGRKFTATTSELDPTLVVQGAHGLQHCDVYNDGWLSILRWNMQKGAQLAAKLDAMKEDDGTTVLDNTVITLASSMDTSNHDTVNLPIILLGGGGGVLKQNVYQRWAAEASPQLADLHLMLMQKVYGCPDTTFGKSLGMYTTGRSQPTELLA
ncbi:MAG: hypothetical protein JWM82_2948 [Myxococcales bacterium]|nr:hypothetical protein [Myxococcales bacterium]